MSNRHLLTIVLACLGIITILSLQGSQKIAQVLAPMDSTKNPVNTVQAFYKAVEKGEWLQARGLTTRECWNNLEAQGEVKNWQSTFGRDNSFDFAGFSVDNSQIDSHKAILKGRAVWLSNQGTVPRITQTITLEEGLGGWRISSIQLLQSAGVVELFYAYLNQGQWEQAKALVQPDYWRSLENQGIIAKLKKEYAKASQFLTVNIKNTREDKTQAQIQAEIAWKSSQGSKLQTIIKLSKKGEKWEIRQIDGWPK